MEALDNVFTGNIRNCYIEAKDRTGSSALVKRFCEKSKCIYTTFREGTPAECVRSFRTAIENFIDEPIGQDADTFADLFHLLSGIVKEYEPILVFDKSHYAPQEFADQVKWFSEAQDVMIIIIGHRDPKKYDMTFSERIELGDLSFEECMRLHPKIQKLDAFKIYLAVGSNPAYHAVMNKGDFETSVEKAFLGNFPKLTMESELVIRRSGVPYGICCAVLSDIANCIGRPVDIAAKEGISRQLCDIYLKKLVEEDIVKTLVPMGNSPKKPAYIFKNPLIAFYFMAVRNVPESEFPDKAGFADIERHADMFLELRFRDFCEDYLRKHYECVRIGRWWLKEENTSKPTLTAVVNIDGTEKTIIADCKFRKGKIDQGAMKSFVKRAAEIGDVPEKIPMMFSVSGFDDKLIKKAKAERIVLVDFCNFA